MSIDLSIRKRFKDFSLAADFRSDTESMGILGASGCGKSMTLKCIAGIETPDSGRIVVNKTVLFDSEQKINIPPQKRRVGYMFQNYALFPHMNIEDNIACALEHFKGDKKNKDKKKKIEEMLLRFHLLGLEKRYPSQLSGGQQQRAALARIIAYDPELLLLDEPFSALDSFLKEKLQIELLDMLKDYSGDTIMVSHNRDEVYKLCRKLMVMDNGKSLALGDTKSMFCDPKFLTVAKLTGCKNFSKVRIVNDHLIEAIDWGFQLETSVIVPKETDYIGIRAHDFKPLAQCNEDVNVIPIQVIKQLDAPFEKSIIFKKANQNKGESGELWWQINKVNYSVDYIPELPKYLKIEPQNILLLKS